MDALIQASKTAMECAYAPYSGFKLGAAVLGGSQCVYTGCNVENASYGLSVCAERVAVLKAVCAGEKEIQAIAVCNSTGKPSFPCGACRQVLIEFAPEIEPMKIYLVSDNGVEMYMLDELMPHPFEY